MTTQLSHIPTDELVAELQRRQEAAPVPVPAWARWAIALVSQQAGVPAAAIIGPGRTERVAVARHLAMHALRIHCPDRSLVEIGGVFHRDHGTVVHACQRVKGILDTGDRWAPLARAVSLVCQNRQAEVRSGKL